MTGQSHCHSRVIKGKGVAVIYIFKNLSFSIITSEAPSAGCYIFVKHPSRGVVLAAPICSSREFFLLTFAEQDQFGEGKWIIRGDVNAVLELVWGNSTALSSHERSPLPTPLTNIVNPYDLVDV